MDISKCVGTLCPLKEACFRYTAKAGFMQSYLLGIPYDFKTEQCEFYWGKVKQEK